MPDPICLVAAGNTYNPCLLILREKGYRLEAEELAIGMMWSAFKADDSYHAYSPPELLGVVVLGETFGSAWNRQRPDLLDEIIPDPPDES